MAELKPAFRPDGEVTAGNSCPLNDGAAAVMVMSEERATPARAKAAGQGRGERRFGPRPEIMGLGPVGACQRALARAGMTMADIDLVEINEAFAAQVIPCVEQLGIDEERLNVHGGAIALGHPFGMTGARIMTTLLNGLETADAPWVWRVCAWGRPRDGNDRGTALASAEIQPKSRKTAHCLVVYRDTTT